MLLVRDLYKEYSKVAAVCGIDFSVKKGKMLALLGPNGAGKSTTLNILSMQLEWERGTVHIDGVDAKAHTRKIKKMLGVVFQEGVLDEALSVYENLYFRGGLYGMDEKQLSERIQSVSRMTGLEAFLKRPYGKLSGGQKRRCDIARALMPAPKLLLLDEPTTGLDPQMRQEIWNTMNDVRKQQEITVLLTTHYMEEAAIADEVAIMKQGKIILQGTPAKVKEQFSSDRLYLFSQEHTRLMKRLEQGGYSYRLEKAGVDIPIHKTQQAIPILQLCRGIYTDFEVRRGTMEDAYLSALGGA